MKAMNLAAALALLAVALPAHAQPVNGPATPSVGQPATLSAAAPPTQPDGPHALTREDAAAWLDGYMPTALARGEVAGAVVVVVKDGQVLLQKGYGVSDVAARKPVDPETTLFRPGSVSKLFTWTACMQLVEQGKLGLDTDVNTYLDFRVPPYQGRPVTLRNLMTHTAGFEETAKDLIYAEPSPEPPLDAYLKGNMPARIFAPGTTPSYSNYGATLAGYIVQRASGQTFDDYIDQHIFSPLGMQHATFRQPLPQALRPLMSHGYDLATKPAKTIEVVGPAPAGSSAVSGADMAKFMIAHLQDGQYNGQRILQPATAQMMHTTALNNIPPLNSMLLGFYQMNRNGRRAIGHAGDTQWFHTELMLLPDDHVGLFISLNSVGVDGAAGPIRQGLREQFMDRYFPGPVPADRLDPKQAVAQAAAFDGSYITSRRVETNFFSLLYYLMEQTSVATDAEGQVTASSIKDLARQTRLLVPAAPFVWRAAGGSMRVAAKLDHGQVMGWSDDESPFEVYTPVPWFKDGVWLRPALIAAVAALLLTALFWPVTALYRRRYRATLPLTGTAATFYRLTRAACLLDAILMIAWPVTIITMFETFALNGSFDPLIMVLHWSTIVIFPLAVLIFLGDVWVVWTTRAGAAGAFARVWSVVLALSGAMLLWTGIMFHLIGTGLNY